MTELPLARQFDLIEKEFADETLIYDLTINKAVCLNESLTNVWRLCNGKNSVADITESLNRKIKASLTNDFVWLALDQLKKYDLLQNSEQLEIDLSGLSRRQMIRKVGLASMIALPVISSIIAPNAVMAASGCVNPNRAAPGTFLGGAAGAGTCNTPVNGNIAGNNACTTVRGNLCCSGRAEDRGSCRDSAPGPNFGTFSVSCYCV